MVSIQADTAGHELMAAVLAATDPLHVHGGAPLAAARKLLQSGVAARGIIDAMVDLHELYFEGTDQASHPYKMAVQCALELIPLLAAAGDTVSPEARESARYNCDPAIQRALAAVATS